MNWKSADFGPFAHGISVWLLADGIPVLTYLQDQLTGLNTAFDWSRFTIGLLAAILTAFISAARNKGAMTLDKADGQAVKAIQGTSAGNAMVVTTMEPTTTAGTAPNIPAGSTVIIPAGQTPNGA